MDASLGAMSGGSRPHEPSLEKVRGNLYVADGDCNEPLGESALHEAREARSGWHCTTNNSFDCLLTNASSPRFRGSRRGNLLTHNNCPTSAPRGGKPPLALAHVEIFNSARGLPAANVNRTDAETSVRPSWRSPVVYP
jgi:hypothetical protein